ncbi:hypothetical protein F5X99DRAFT_431130, partial [Biscogniauxia marginata]
DRLARKSGKIYIPRVIEAPHINKLLESETHGMEPVMTGVSKEWNDADNPLELRFTPGRLDSFHFGPDTSTLRPLQEDEVRISVKGTGINFKDVIVALNQVNDDHIVQDFAGTVIQTGTTSNITLCLGGRSHVMKILDWMPFTEACAIPVAYATAQYGLCHLFRLKPGEHILIHAAAGAVGQAAIQIAQRITATIYVTVSTSEEKELLMNRYGIESSHFFSSRHISFAQQIMQKTSGRGVDVILNSLSGQALAECWRCLTAFGRFIEICNRDINTFKTLPMEPFQRNVSFFSLDVAQHT